MTSRVAPPLLARVMVRRVSSLSLDPRVTVPTSADDHVVLLDHFGRETGTAVKRWVHHADTPFHLAVSCYAVRADGKVLLTRRAAGKTFEGVWTNACCGHPRPGEAQRDAVQRHMGHEIGATPRALRLALADFTYRAEASNGVVEHELCPVFVAEIDNFPIELNPDEADAAEWVTWPDLVRRAELQPQSLSPWCVAQIARLRMLFDDPLTWVRCAVPAPRPSATKPAELRPNPFGRMGSTVDDVVERFLHTAHRDLAELDPLAAELTEPITALYRAGGKRLRPCLVYCGYAAGRADPGTVTNNNECNLAYVAAAVEMLHTFALLHDDVMDKSVLRRGSPTAHRWFADVREHANSGHEWFGNAAAIVAGDLAFVWADELLDHVRVDEALMHKVRHLFNLLRREVITGQYLDLRLAGPCATDQQALSVALLKSARYTVTRPLQLGATLASADDATLNALCTYGDAMGVAFQLRDDVLGVFGDPAVTGKGNAEDLRSGKASLLLVRALELSAPAHRQVLLASLGCDDLDDASEAQCREAVLASGALASVEALISQQLDTALSALRYLPSDVAHDLEELALQLAHRSL